MTLSAVQSVHVVWGRQGRRGYRSLSWVHITHIARAARAIHMEGRVVLERLKGHRGEVNSLSICGDRLASASSDGSVRIWDLRLGK